MEDIHLIIRLADDLHLIHGDASAMDQIITNLSINARDAMPDGGELSIQTSNVTIKNQENDIPPGEYVLFIIADTGIGMSNEVQKHIFEPFFSTKDRKGSTGLGLSTCFGIVTESGGAIDVETLVGEGTTVNVFLPAGQLESRPAVQPPWAGPGENHG